MSDTPTTDSHRARLYALNGAQNDETYVLVLSAISALEDTERELAAEKQRSEKLEKALRELVWCLGPDNPNDYRPTQIFSRTDRAILDGRAALGDSNA